MDYTQDLYLAPLFNFNEFFESGFLTDCEIRVHNSHDDPEYTSIKAHQAVLANASDFFYNTFTSGMQEAKTGIVDVYTNPMNLFPEVVRWMYNGCLDFCDAKLMALLGIAHNYGITLLENELTAHLEKVVTKDNITVFVQQCFDCGLSEELKALEPTIARYIDEIPITQLSDALDVATFAEVLSQCKMSNEQKIQKIQQFLGDWETSEEEKQALGQCLTKENGLRALLTGKDYPWLPAGFVRLVH